MSPHHNLTRIVVSILAVAALAGTPLATPAAANAHGTSGQAAVGSSQADVAASGARANSVALPAGLWVRPIGSPGGPTHVIHAFAPPTQPWLAGHRGVDLAGVAGAEVRSAGAGTVTYAGPLAGRGVVVVDHGALRTTYEPIAATVPTGDTVAAGTPIGTLTTTASHCAPQPCLHWGARDGDGYLDPTALLTGDGVRLLPLGERTVSGAPPPPPRPLAPFDGQPAPPPDGTGAATLRWPVARPRVTSPFGMRVHPVTGVYKLHDGTDFAAPCGTPVRAAAGGWVSQAAPRGAYGLQVTIDHGRVGGVPMTTSYSHLSRAMVSPGRTVAAGEIIGLAGTTGLSTGCHLHFMVYAAGSLSDPMDWLPATRATSHLAKEVRRPSVGSERSEPLVAARVWYWR